MLWMLQVCSFKKHINLACSNSFEIFLWCSSQGLIDGINALNLLMITVIVLCPVVIGFRFFIDVAM